MGRIILGQKKHAADEVKMGLLVIIVWVVMFWRPFGF
jgi:hypothetical protein